MPTSIKVSIDNDDSVMAHVDRIEFVEALDALDMLRIDLVPPSHGDVSEVQGLAALGAPWKVELMEDGSAVGQPGEGEVLEVRHVLRRRGGYRLEVVGLDKLHRLRGHHPAQVWEDATHTTVIQDIASRNSLEATVTGLDTSQRVVFEPDVSDAVFLRNLAREHHFSVRISQGKIAVAAYTPTGTACTVDWSDGVHEMVLSANLDGIATDASVYAYDLDQETAIEGTVAKTALNQTSGSDTGAALVQSKFGARKVLIHHAGYLTPTAATARATAELQRRADQFVRGTLVCEGHPKARAGVKVTVENAPWPYAGDFLIREVRHVLDRARGYRTIIHFMSDSLPAQ